MKKNLTGQRFGRLVVTGPAVRVGQYIKWHCQCDCGKVATPYQFSLTSGKSKSCGCIAAEKAKERWARPSDEARAAQSAKSKTHGMSKHPAYRSWMDMKQRCVNKKNKFYDSYGGRGIRVCDEWKSFDRFWLDLGESWFPGAQIGRIDNDGNYSKHNCRWETAEQQQNNKSNSLIVATPDGPMTASQAAKKYGLTFSCILHRHRSGYPPEDLIKPSQRTQKC